MTAALGDASPSIDRFGILNKLKYNKKIPKWNGKYSEHFFVFLLLYFNWVAIALQAFLRDYVGNTKEHVTLACCKLFLFWTFRKVKFSRPWWHHFRISYFGSKMKLCWLCYSVYAMLCISGKFQSRWTSPCHKCGRKVCHKN